MQQHLKTVVPSNNNILTIKYLPLKAISELSSILFEGNPKKHDLDLIQLSIAENGFIDPPKWDANLNSGKGGIVYGNGRLEALVSLLKERQRKQQPPPNGIGITEDGDWCIPIKFGCDAESEIAAKRLAIDHNNLTNTFLDAEQQALQYDEELYSDLLQQLGAENKPITVDEEFLEEILQEASQGQSSQASDAEEAEVRNVPPRCEVGQIWQLGKHRLFVGDCLDKEMVEKLLEGKVPDLIWSDPPYGMKCQKKDGRIGSGGQVGGKSKVFKAKAYPIIAGDENTDILKTAKR